MSLALAAVAIAGFAAVASAASGGRHAQLRGFVCQRALDPAGRGVSVSALMRPVTGTAKMALRFELLKRGSRHSRAASVAGPGLRNWVTPPPRRPPLGARAGDRWIVKHPVVDLTAPAFYQFRVTFRWSDSAGRAIGRAVRLSRQCFQPELRPDLRVTAVNVTPLPADPGSDAFVAQIRNSGRTAAGRFDVQLADGPVMKTTTVARLPAHAGVQIDFDGPACSAAAPATVTADPAHAVDDANRANNAMRVTCG